MNRYLLVQNWAGYYEDKNTVGEMIAALQAEYPDVEGMEKDIQRALDELLEETLIFIS